ncbi:MAG: DUF488 domain-containing protein [Nitrospinae bacterium]|nr:DUF488 domain-containing protein [Nitrospinota bacterium]
MTEYVFTIGHSNHQIEKFIELLRLHGINALCDVRSHPYSRFAPQFSIDPLRATLAKTEISYVFLGKELGARSENPACYRQGRVQYDRLAQEPDFVEGIKRLIKGMDRYRIALMCSEKDPLDCHRALLVARKLFETGVQVSHIHSDGSLESHHEFESRLLALCKLPEGDLFKGRDAFLLDAYLIRGEHVAYEDETMEQPEKVVVP